ncbi:WD40 repeat-like protein [Panus rudis PR-1116 ss-1]|nr:WD40 repeat-like protein [Panus rudis PR-1116 ss-1]
MRTKHSPHSLPGFPVYSCAFVSENELVLGGGGGQSKTGIKNKLRLYRVNSEKVMELLDELELDKGEDAPMSMAASLDDKEIICGINSSEEQLKVKQNQNCRVFGIKDGKLVSRSTTSTLSILSEEDDFQKVTVLSPDHSLLAAAGTKDLSVLKYPSLEPLSSAITISKGEIYDAAFSSSTLVIATTVNLLIYNLPDDTDSEKKAGKHKATSSASLQLLKTVDRPELPGKDAGSSFRAIRFHPDNPKFLYAVLNTVPPRTRTKSLPRRAFICKFDTDTWKVLKVRKVSDKGVTCFDISPNGRFLAFGSSDLTVGIIDAQTFAPLVTILKAHDFPPTTLRFNPTSRLLVSGSADNTVRLVSVPENLGASSWSSWIIIIVTLLILLFAFIAQQMRQAYA